jgi:enamine deaminase RidA (YjgF/YER057c/UK114 family)
VQLSRGMSTITHLNPQGLPSNPGFSQAVVVETPTRMIFVGGQNAVAADGTVDGDDLVTQTRRALRNLELVLAAAGATLGDVVSWSISVVDGHPLGAAFGAFQEIWPPSEPPPAISVAIVAALANPAFLVEITAVAVG